MMTTLSLDVDLLTVTVTMTSPLRGPIAQLDRERHVTRCIAVALDG